MTLLGRIYPILSFVYIGATLRDVSDLEEPSFCGNDPQGMHFEFGYLRQMTTFEYFLGFLIIIPCQAIHS